MPTRENEREALVNKDALAFRKTCVCVGGACLLVCLRTILGTILQVFASRRLVEHSRSPRLQDNVLVGSSRYIVAFLCVSMCIFPISTQICVLHMHIKIWSCGWSGSIFGPISFNVLRNKSRGLRCFRWAWACSSWWSWWVFSASWWPSWPNRTWSSMIVWWGNSGSWGGWHIGKCWEMLGRERLNMLNFGWEHVVKGMIECYTPCRIVGLLFLLDRHGPTKTAC